MDWLLLLKSVGVNLLFAVMLGFGGLFCGGRDTYIYTIKSRLIVLGVVCVIACVCGVVLAVLHTDIGRIKADSFVGMCVNVTIIVLFWPRKVDEDRVKKLEQEDKEYVERVRQGKNYGM